MDLAQETARPGRPVAADLRRLVAALAATDLAPGPRVDALFAALVDMALSLPAGHPALARAEECARVRALCARGEGRLEEHWAERIVAEPTTVRAFPYVRNYLRLVRGEWQALLRVLPRRPRRVTFVGSGPLPLSALLLGRQAPGLVVTCVDRDARALELGRRVATSLCADTDRFRFRVGDAARLDVRDSDVVVLAALVGASAAEKTALLEAVAASLPEDGVLAVRSVPPGGRELLYPRVTRRDLPASLDLLAEWLPPPTVVNSLLLLRRASTRINAFESRSPDVCVP